MVIGSARFLGKVKDRRFWFFCWVGQCYSSGTFCPSLNPYFQTNWQLSICTKDGKWIEIPILRKTAGTTFPVLTVIFRYFEIWSIQNESFDFLSDWAKFDNHCTDILESDAQSKSFPIMVNFATTPTNEGTLEFKNYIKRPGMKNFKQKKC